MHRSTEGVADVVLVREQPPDKPSAEASTEKKKKKKKVVLFAPSQAKTAGAKTTGSSMRTALLPHMRPRSQADRREEEHQRQRASNMMRAVILAAFAGIISAAVATALGRRGWIRPGNSAALLVTSCMICELPHCLPFSSIHKRSQLTCDVPEPVA